MSQFPTPPGGARPPTPPAPGSYTRPGPTASLKPRKVRGGLKLESKEGPVSNAWAGQRLMRLLEDRAPGAALAQGIEYARLAQTRSLTVAPGSITARVQGRMPTAYGVSVAIPVFTPEQWELVVAAMSAEAKYVAALLAGDVPASIEDLFVPLKLRLFPHEASDVSATCSCHRWDTEQAGYAPWCKHVCCAIALVAERLGREPFVAFELRGLRRDDLLEQLRQRRAVAGGSGGSDRPVPVYAGRSSGRSDTPPLPLDQCLERFWAAGPELESIELPIGPPPVSHPLLRRMGPSPFEGSRFPMVGLLATCYDVFTRAAVAEPAVHADSDIRLEPTEKSPAHEHNA
ncbi:MAG: hypothetical protein JNM07_04890 [Phycisphaerae bacterium]|nr:hypothetical protein [Phycisphaerae bacterium]